MLKRTVLITGASSGIGKACALYLAEHNYHVFAGVTNEVSAAKLQPEIDPEKIEIIIMDVTNENSVQEAFQVIRDKAPQGLDGVINNAGTVVAAPAELIPVHEYQRQFDVNYFGMIRVSQMFLPLVRLKKGRIINISSVLGRICIPAHAAYCSSKFAIKAFTQILRMELKAQEIDVVLIEPGSVRSNIWNVSFDSMEKIFHNSPESKRKYYTHLKEATKKTLHGFAERSIDPVKVARVILKALTVSRPKTHYMIGWDVKLLNLVGALPERLKERVLFQIMGLSSDSEMIKEVVSTELLLSE